MSTTTPLSTSADILRAAADIIETNGWWAGSAHEDARGYPSRCVVLAVANVLDSIGVEHPADRKRLQTFDEIGRQWFGRTKNDAVAQLIAWNDKQDDGDAVVARMREVAAELDENSGSQR